MVEMQILGSHEEWLRARTKIGGSDASAIFGMSPYKTNVELFKEKAYGIEPEDISDKPYVKYGTEAEKHLRELFKLDYPQYQVGYVENNMFTNDKYPWAHASLDGWLMDRDGRNGVLEIKTTEILQSSQKKKWDNRVPDNYYIQVLHYLMVTEFEYAVLKAQLKFEIDGEVYLQTKGFRVARKGWNGKGMFVVFQKGYPDGIPCNKQTAEAWGISEGDLFKCNPYLQIRCVDGSHSMWVPSINDCLAEDWIIVK